MSHGLQQGAHGFKFTFELEFENLGQIEELRVVIAPPYPYPAFERRKTEGDVVIINSAKKLIGVQIKKGDLPVAGTYQYQAFDESNGGSIPSDVGRVQVNASLQVPGTEDE